MIEVLLDTANGASYRTQMIGETFDIQWSTGWGNGGPGGCQGASWSMDLPQNYTHPAFTVGSYVRILDGGGLVYRGRLGEPERGEPWRFHAKGLSALGASYLCLDATSLTTSVPFYAVSEAITRGLPWRTDEITLPTTPFSANTETGDLNYVNALLDAYAAKENKRWAVWADQQLRMKADPTTPTWLILPGTGISGVADEEFATHVYGRWVSAVDPTTGVPTDWTTTLAADTWAASRFGRREYKVDLTKLGLMDPTVALVHVQSRLAQLSQRIGYTSPLDVTEGQVYSIGGVPARLSQIRAGDMVRMFGVLDAQGNLSMQATQDIVIAETTYTAGGSLRLSPQGLVPRSFADVLAAPEPPQEVFSE